MKQTGEGTISIGRHCVIDDSAQVVFARPGRIFIGDYCHIGPGVKLVCAGGDIDIGDWSSLHDRCLILSEGPVRVGAHGWFGQNSVIDGTGGISIGKGVRVGMLSQLWSHVAAGEQIEGCTLYGQRPVSIEDDVWLVGSCIVASGVTLGVRSVALIGSNITKSWPAYSVLAGSPAMPKEGLSFYTPLSPEKKWAMLKDWLVHWSQERGYELQESGKDEEASLTIFVRDQKETIRFTWSASLAQALRFSDPSVTVCCLEDKTYNKTFSKIEYAALKHLAGNKARFYTSGF